VAEALRPLGDTMIETFGVFPTFAATIPGSHQHVPLLELEDALLSYLPVVANSCESGNGSGTMLVLHREDQSLGAIDIFAKGHLNANALIIGSSGRGKSVLTGVLTASLLHDESVKLIKVDVGGSHSRECELAGGVEFRLILDRPSGLNPFSFAKHNISESGRAVLGKFIEVLVMEDGESTLPKTVRVEIDDLLSAYFASKPASPTLDDFYESATGFSRRKLLSRWCKGGLYGNAFAAPDGHCGAPRLRYFNFSQIFQAADPDFAQAGMAAVLAQFNLELLENPEMRIVLICDETPFFIDRCFEFFKFSMANVRKFGASVVLIVQLSQHLVKNGDTGLMENAHHRFLFSADGADEDFARRLGLAVELVKRIRELKSIPKVSSEFLYQFGGETRTMVLKLTADEFWRVTSTQADRLKVERLREAVPELSLKEILSCLSRIG
jgi:type IV secretory pathway VirB4 component